MTKQKITVALDPDAADALAKLATKRKQGELISQLIKSHIETPENIGVLERLEGKIDKLIELLEKSIEGRK